MKFKLITRDNHHQLSEPQTYWGSTKRALLILLVPTQKPRAGLEELQQSTANPRLAPWPCGQPKALLIKTPKVEE